MSQTMAARRQRKKLARKSARMGNAPLTPGQAVLVGEGGPEVVIPKKKGGFSVHPIVGAALFGGDWSTSIGADMAWPDTSGGGVGSGGGGGGGYSSGGGGAVGPQWAPGEYELEQQKQAVNQQLADVQQQQAEAGTHLDQLNYELEKYTYEKNFAEAKRVQNEMIGIQKQQLQLDQQKLQLQTQLDWFNANQTQRQGDIQMRSDDISAALDMIGYQLQGDDMMRKDMVSRFLAEMQIPQEERLRYTAEADARIAEQQNQLTGRGQDINAILGMGGLQTDIYGKQIDESLGLGQLALGMSQEDRMRAQQQIDAELAYGNQQIDQYKAAIDMYSAQGQIQLAQDAEARMRAQMQQNAALEQASLGIQGYTAGIQGQGTAVNALTNLAGEEGKRNQWMSELAANPHDWIQLARATGSGQDFLSQLIGGNGLSGQNLGTGEGSFLGEGWDALASQVGKTPAFAAALTGAQQLQGAASQTPNVPSLDSILGLGALGPQQGSPPAPGSPRTPDLMSLLGPTGELGPLPQMPGRVGAPNLQNPLQPGIGNLNLDPNWGGMPTLGAQRPEPYLNYQAPPTIPHVGAEGTGPPGGYAAAPIAKPVIPMPGSGGGSGPPAPPVAPPAPPVDQRGGPWTTLPTGEQFRQDQGTNPDGTPRTGGRVAGRGVDPKVALPPAAKKILAAAPKAASPKGKPKPINPNTGKPFTSAEWEYANAIKKNRGL